VTFLLDINVLIALVDPAHIDHDAAHIWFRREGRLSWATCPITQNGLIRIIGHPKYPNFPGSPALVAELLQSLVRLPGHIFWPDAISILDTLHVDAAELLTSAQITDTYLLALAGSQGGLLATLDRRLSIKASTAGKNCLRLIQS
jgi:toxin-antitoxin system PIN domain toxin